MRFDVDIGVSLRGRGGIFSASTIDASRSGVMLQLPGAAPDAARAAWAQRLFRTGADVCFADSDVKVRADFVRVGSGDEIRMAFRFRRRLTEEACRKLGIPFCDDGEPTF